MKKVLKIIGIIFLVLIIILGILAIKGYIESRQPVYEDDYYKDFKSDSELDVGPGDDFVVGIPSTACHLFDADGKAFPLTAVYKRS